MPLVLTREGIRAALVRLESNNSMLAAMAAAVVLTRILR
jgi:hypothetical protein